MSLETVHPFFLCVFLANMIKRQIPFEDSGFKQSIAQNWREMSFLYVKPYFNACVFYLLIIGVF